MSPRGGWRAVVAAALLTLTAAALPAQAAETAVVTGQVVELPPELDETPENPGERRGVPGVTVSDGQNMTRTDASGRYRLEVDVERRHADLVFVSVPSGYTVDPDEHMTPQFFQHVELTAGGTAVADFALRRDPASTDQRYRAFALADVHVQAGTANDRERASAQIEQLNELVTTAASGPNSRRNVPRFTVVSGDVTNDATHAEFEDYKAATATSLVPVWPAVGNHEHAPGAGTYRDAIDNYRQHLGPEWYSFSYGGQHFVMLDNSSTNALADDDQLEWLRQELEWNAADKDVVVVTHVPWNTPETLDPDRTQLYIDLLEQYDTTLVLAGHTHSNDVDPDVIEGAKHVATTSLSYAIDQTPTGFRLLEFDGRGTQPEVSFRALDVSEPKITVVHPAPDAQLPAESTQLVINIYHTSTWAEAVRVRVGNADPWIALEPQGTHSWTAPLDAGELAEGTHQLIVEVINNARERRTETSTFEIVPPGRIETPEPGEEWAMFQRDAQHSGVAGDELSPELGLAWSWHSGGTILTSSPALHDGAAFIGIRDEDGPEQNAIAAIDLETGQERWRVHADAQVEASPAAADGIAYAGSIRGTTYALDAATGELVWKREVGSDVPAGGAWQYFSPTIADGVLYQAFSSRVGGTRMVALDAATGEELWTTGSLGVWWISHASPVVGDDYVYTAVANGTIRAIDRETGNVAWSNLPAGFWMRSSPVYADGLVLLNYEGDVLVALDGTTGAEVWRYTSPQRSRIGGQGTASAPAVADGVAYVGFADGNVTALDLASGLPVWSQPTDGGVISSPAVSGDYVYVGSNDGHVYGLDRDTGQPLWSHEIGTWVASSPAVTGNTLVVGAWDGALYAFTPDGSEPTPRWPQATLQGTVTDDRGDPVPAAQVQVRDDSGHTLVQVRSRADGSYVLRLAGEPDTYEVVAVRHGHLSAREDVILTEAGDPQRVDLELDAVRDPTAGATNAPTDFAHTVPWTESVRAGEDYHYAMNGRVHASITSQPGGDRMPGGLQPGWLTDFALTDDVAVETVDWTEYVLTSEAPRAHVISCCPGPGWRDEWLPLPDISVDDDTVIASGTAQIDDSLEGTMRYRTLPDAPVMKLTLEITNTGGSDFEGSFHYNVDPDSLPSAVHDWDVAIVPGVGNNPGLIDAGWTANYIYDGPTDPRDDHPAHGIAWLDDEPIALSGYGRIFGVWFDASTAAGSTTEISWYHITDYPAAGDDVTANIGRWAAELDRLDDEAAG